MLNRKDETRTGRAAKLPIASLSRPE
jgi:hypothetical protein